MSDRTITLDKVLDLSAALSPDEQLRLICMVSERLRHLGSARVDIRDLAGLGADVWRDIDVDAYLNQERDSWDRWPAIEHANAWRA